MSTQKPENWMRCLVIQNEHKVQQGSGVLFPDDTVVIHWRTGGTTVYKDSVICATSIDPKGKIVCQEVMVGQ